MFAKVRLVRLAVTVTGGKGGVIVDAEHRFWCLAHAALWASVSVVVGGGSVWVLWLRLESEKDTRKKREHGKQEVKRAS